MLKITDLGFYLLFFWETQIVSLFLLQSPLFRVELSWRRIGKKMTSDVIWFGDSGSCWFHHARELESGAWPTGWGSWLKTGFKVQVIEPGSGKWDQSKAAKGNLGKGSLSNYQMPDTWDSFCQSRLAWGGFYNHSNRQDRVDSCHGQIFIDIIQIIIFTQSTQINRIEDLKVWA